tara:strand:- start:206 stop:457 length:252 start_codon:yes stop_codon:yes gene_type:complete
MDIELSELKKMIREEVEAKYGDHGTSMLLESPQFDNHRHRGVSFGVPKTDSKGNMLSERVQRVYVKQMKEFLDMFFGQVDKKQ